MNPIAKEPKRKPQGKSSAPPAAGERKIECPSCGTLVKEKALRPKRPSSSKLAADKAARDEFRFLKRTVEGVICAQKSNVIQMENALSTMRRCEVEAADPPRKTPRRHSQGASDNKNRMEGQKEAVKIKTEKDFHTRRSKDGRRKEHGSAK